jgi:hypothetical protein
MARSGKPIGISIAMSDFGVSSAIKAAALVKILTSGFSKDSGVAVTAIQPALQPSTPAIRVGAPKLIRLLPSGAILSLPVDSFSREREKGRNLFLVVRLNATVE